MPDSKGVNQIKKILSNLAYSITIISFLFHAVMKTVCQSPNWSLSLEDTFSLQERNKFKLLDHQLKKMTNNWQPNYQDYLSPLTKNKKKDYWSSFSKSHKGWKEE